MGDINFYKKMKICKRCNAENRDIAKFCNKCGYTLPENTDIAVNRHVPEDSEKIDFILYELEGWKNENIINEEVYLSIKSKYENPKKPLLIKELLEKAKEYYLKKEWDQAISCAKKALEQDNELSAAYVIAGKAYMQKGELFVAINKFERAQEIEPENDQTANLIQSIKYTIKREKEKQEQIERFFKVEDTGKIGEDRETERVERINDAEKEERTEEEKIEETIKPPTPPKPPQPQVTPLDPGFDWSSHVGAFLEKSSLNWWYITGAFILLAGVIGLVTWQWSLLGKYAIFVILLLATIGLYWTGALIVDRLKLGGLIITSVASLLVPINFYVFNRFEIAGTSFNWNYVGIVASVFCVGIYLATTRWLKAGYFVLFTSASIVSLIHFILQVSHVDYYYYGIFFMPLAGAYMIFAYIYRKNEVNEYALPLFVIANAMAAFVLASTSLNPGFFYGQGINSTIVMFLMAGVIYTVSAYLYDSNTMVYVSSLLILSFAFL